MKLFQEALKFTGSVAPGPIGKFLKGFVENKEQNEYNEKQYERQRQQNLDDWNLVNAYNTPQNQMQRFMDAGLNKHMVASQGSPGNAGVLGQTQVPTQQQQDLGPVEQASDPKNILGMASSGLAMQGTRIANDLTAQKFLDQKIKNINAFKNLNDRIVGESKHVNGKRSFPSSWEQNNTAQRLKNEIAEVQRDLLTNTQEDQEKIISEQAKQASSQSTIKKIEEASYKDGTNLSQQKQYHLEQLIRNKDAKSLFKFLNEIDAGKELIKMATSMLKKPKIKK